MDDATLVEREHLAYLSSSIECNGLSLYWRLGFRTIVEYNQSTPSGG